MISSSHKRLIHAARLGLRGERAALLEYIQEVAVDEINKNHYEVHHSLMQLLAEEGLARPALSNSLNSVPDEHLSTDIDISNIWLSPGIQQRVDKLLQFFKKTANDKDRQSLKRILLYGPPGTGKTTLGFYVAGQLGLKVRYVKVTDLLSSRLGETMKNISDIFQTPGREVIFIDEFDAFAKTRSDNNDVGELKRIVNSMIQTLDFVSSEKVVIVATNLVDSIDTAILRRFPFKIEVGPLVAAEKKDFLMHLVKRTKGEKINLTDKEWSFLFDVFNLLGLSTIDDLKGIIEKAEVEMVFADRSEVTYRDFLEALFSDGYLSKLKGVRTQNKKLLAKLLQEVESLGYSKSHVSTMLGIHRNTYPKYASEK